MAKVILDTTLTYREYCLIPDDGKRHEIVEGIHHMTPTPRPPHHDTSKGLFTILFVYFEKGRGGKDVVQPDLVVVMKLTQISGRGIEGPPLLVVEILSPSNIEYDRRIKGTRYAELGVPHYWIADPDTRTLECYENEGGRYVLCASGRDRETVTHPDFPGLDITLPSVWPAYCASRNIGVPREEDAQSGGEFERGGGPPLSVGPAGRAPRLP